MRDSILRPGLTLLSHTYTTADNEPTHVGLVDTACRRMSDVLFNNLDQLPYNVGDGNVGLTNTVQR